MSRLAIAGVFLMAGLAGSPAAARGDVAGYAAVVVVADRDPRGYDGQRRGDWRGAGPAFRYGYDRGWREGSEEGHNDGRKRRDPRYWREGEFRDGDRGYKGWMGPRWDYARGFRSGYESGYRRAYAASRPGWRDRYDRYGRYRYPDGRHSDDRYPDGRYREDRYRYPDDRDRLDRYDPDQGHRHGPGCGHQPYRDR